MRYEQNMSNNDRHCGSFEELGIAQCRHKIIVGNKSLIEIMFNSQVMRRGLKMRHQEYTRTETVHMKKWHKSTEAVSITHE